jgi:predicted Zn-dependent peptidase
MRTLVMVAGLVIAVLGSPAHADDDVPSIPFERYQLDNGLEIILHRDNRVPLVSVDVWYHVGMADERPGESGFAHLFEHMFKNSEHLGGRHHYDILKHAGSKAANATTNGDRTNYYEVVPANQLELALWLESDRMGYFLPGLDAPRFERQREVVRNERRQSLDNRPYGRDRLAIAAGLYPEGHPRRYLTIGRHEDLEVATVEMVRRFYRKWYVPANATVMVAGDFDPAEARALVQKWFGTFPRSTKPIHRYAAAPAVKRTRVELSDPFAKLRRVHYAWRSLGAYEPGDAELAIATKALAAGGTGRLYQILVLDKQLAQSVWAYQTGGGGIGELHLGVDLRTGADQAEVERILDQEIERMRREPITQRELDRAVVQREAGFIWALESLRTRMAWLHHYNHHAGDPGYIARDFARYRDATPEGIRGAVEHYFDPAHRVEVITIPAKARPAP